MLFFSFLFFLYLLRNAAFLGYRMQLIMHLRSSVNRWRNHVPRTLANQRKHYCLLSSTNQQSQSSGAEHAFRALSIGSKCFDWFTITFALGVIG